MRNWLADMVNSARRATDYVQGIDEAEFYASMLLQDATAGRIAVIGEAARQVSGASRAMIANLPWKQIVNMRNKLIHDYGHIRADLIWATLRDDLPFLVTEIETYLLGRSGGGS